MTRPTDTGPGKRRPGDTGPSHFGPGHSGPAVKPGDSRPV